MLEQVGRKHPGVVFTDTFYGYDCHLDTQTVLDGLEQTVDLRDIVRPDNRIGITDMVISAG